jgi:hypothetical protein
VQDLQITILTPDAATRAHGHTRLHYSPVRDRLHIYSAEPASQGVDGSPRWSFSRLAKFRVPPSHPDDARLYAI